MTPFHEKVKLVTRYLVLVYQLDIPVEEITSRDMINALAWNPNPYLSLSELNREHLYIEGQGIQLCNNTVVFLMREASGFSRIPLKQSGLCPYRMTETHNRIWREWYQALLDCREGMGLFLGLAVDCSICQLSIAMHKNMLIHLYLPPHISL